MNFANKIHNLLRYSKSIPRSFEYDETDWDKLADYYNRRTDIPRSDLSAIRHLYNPGINPTKVTAIMLIGSLSLSTLMFASGKIDNNECAGRFNLPVVKGQTYNQVLDNANAQLELIDGEPPNNYILPAYIGNLNYGSDIWDYTTHDGRPVVVADGVSYIVIPRTCKT